jgi:RNA polymerase sigma-70 factor (ECF subfamily)
VPLVPEFQDWESVFVKSSDLIPASSPEQWLDEHGDYLYRYALLRTQNEAAAEDLVQDTLIAALSSRSGYAGQSSERTWLTGILKHKIVDHFRRDWRERTLEDDPPNDSSEEPGMDEFFAKDGHWAIRPADWGNPVRSLEQTQFFEVLQKCVERLSPKLRHLFVLKELHDMSNEEICKELEVTATNVWVMLYRARMNLRQCLEVRWFENERRVR